MKKLIYAFIALNLTLNVFSASFSSLKQLANEYHQKSELSLFETTDHCEPNAASCLEVACELVGENKCNNRNELRRVNRACRGNSNGLCLSALCKRLGTFDCDDHREIERLAPACIGNHNGKCIDYVCDRLGHFGCDDESELMDVARECAGTK